MNEKTKTGEENGREEITVDGKRRSTVDVIMRKSEDEKERRKAEVFLIYHLRIQRFPFSHKCDVRIGIKTSSSEIRVYVNSADRFGRQ